MKKLVITSLLFVAPVLMAATADSDVANSPYTNGSNAYQESGAYQDSNSPQAQQHIKFATNSGPRQTQNGMSISSSDFNWAGPVSFTSTYSSTFGWMLSGTYTQKLGKRNAVSLLLTGGAKQQRANVTWGLAIAEQQRLKLTAEYLRQNIDFNFDAGDKKEWEGQQAYGVAYQYIIPHYWLNAINLDVNYSLAQTRNLTTVLFDNNTERNFRRIAGGRDVGMTTGVNIVPNQSTLFDIAANYDNVKYNTKYEKHQDESGFGATLNLQHLLTRRVKWQLMASQKVPVSTYGTELDYLLPTAAGTNLQLVGSVNRDVGKGRLQNDFRVNAGVNYSWGGNPHGDANQTYQLGSEDSASDLNGWVTQPAVERSQVLAVVDQKVEAVSSENKSKNSLLAAGACDPRAPRVNPSKKIPLQEVTMGSAMNKNLGLLSASTSTGGGFFIAGTIWPANNVTVSGLSGTGLTLKAAKANGSTACAAGTSCYLWLTGKLDASIPQAGKSISVTASSAQWPACPDEKQTFTLKETLLNPTITLHPSSNWILGEGDTAITNTASIEANGDKDKIKSVTIGDSTQGHSLAFYNIADNAASLKGKASGTLSFTVTAPPLSKITENPNALEDFPMTVTNEDGKSVKDDLYIGIAGRPVASGEPQGVTNAVSTTIHAIGFSNYFIRPNTVTPKPDKYKVTITKPDGSTTTDPSLLNLEFNTSTGGLEQEADKVIPKVPLGEYKFTVHAANNVVTKDQWSAKGVEFDLTIGQGPAPMISPVSDTVVLTKGQKAADANAKVASMTAHAAQSTIAVKDVSFLPELADHGVVAALKQTQAPTASKPASYDLYLAGTVTNESTAEETYKVKATNSIGQEGESTDPFTLVVKGPPVRNQATLNGGGLNRGVASSVSFTGSFTNNLPTYSGDMHYWLCPSSTYSAENCVTEGQAGTAVTHGLSVTSSAAVAGTIPESTPVQAYTLYIFALNDKGGLDNAKGVSQALAFNFSVNQVPTLRCPTKAEALQTMSDDGKSFTFGGHTFSIIDQPGAPNVDKKTFSEDGYFTNAVINNIQQNMYSCVYAAHNVVSGIYYNSTNIPDPQKVHADKWSGEACGSNFGTPLRTPQDCAITYSNN